MLLKILLIPIIWLLKSLTYWGVFRIRSIPATTLSCLIIAGAPFLLGAVPLPLPGFLSVIASVGFAVYLTMRYTGVELLPEGLFIPVGIELVFQGASWLVQESGLFT